MTELTRSGYSVSQNPEVPWAKRIGGALGALGKTTTGFAAADELSKWQDDLQKQMPATQADASNAANVSEYTTGAIPPPRPKNPDTLSSSYEPPAALPPGAMASPTTPASAYAATQPAQNASAMQAATAPGQPSIPQSAMGQQPVQAAVQSAMGQPQTPAQPPAQPTAPVQSAMPAQTAPQGGAQSAYNQPPTQPGNQPAQQDIHSTVLIPFLKEAINDIGMQPEQAQKFMFTNLQHALQMSKITQNPEYLRAGLQMANDMVKSNYGVQSRVLSKMIDLQKWQTPSGNVTVQQTGAGERNAATNATKLKVHATPSGTARLNQGTKSDQGYVNNLTTQAKIANDEHSKYYDVKNTGRWSDPNRAATEQTLNQNKFNANLRLAAANSDPKSLSSTYNSLTQSLKSATPQTSGDIQNRIDILSSVMAHRGIQIPSQSVNEE
jgi:hypothetical protein